MEEEDAVEAVAEAVGEVGLKNGLDIAQNATSNGLLVSARSRFYEEILADRLDFSLLGEREKDGIILWEHQLTPRKRRFLSLKGVQEYRMGVRV